MNKTTLFSNVTFSKNTLLLTTEASLVYLNFQDEHAVRFVKNVFDSNMLILSFDRAIGYTAPCISLHGYHSSVFVEGSTFTRTSIRFEVYSLPMAGNLLIAARDITVTSSKFVNSC